MFIISNPLFTPYGYKFANEGHDGWDNGRIVERYWSDVKLPQKHPWKFGVTGLVDIKQGNMRNFNVWGSYWSGVCNNSVLGYIELLSTYGSYPADYEYKMLANSVRRYYSTYFLRPMGISLKE